MSSSLKAWGNAEKEKSDACDPGESGGGWGEGTKEKKKGSSRIANEGGDLVGCASTRVWRRHSAGIPTSTLKKAIASISASNSDPQEQSINLWARVITARFPLWSTWEYPNRDQYGPLFNHAMCSHQC